MSKNNSLPGQHAIKYRLPADFVQYTFKDKITYVVYNLLADAYIQQVPPEIKETELLSHLYMKLGELYDIKALSRVVRYLLTDVHVIYIDDRGCVIPKGIFVVDMDITTTVNGTTETFCIHHGRYRSSQSVLQLCTDALKRYGTENVSVAIGCTGVNSEETTQPDVCALSGYPNMLTIAANSLRRLRQDVFQVLSDIKQTEDD